MTTPFGVVDFEVKSVSGSGEAVDDPNDPIGSFYCVLSAPTKDRDGETVDAKAFEPLPDHMTIDVDHGLSVMTTVGSGKPEYEDDLLTVRGTYSSIPRAQEVRTLVREKHIRTMSVAYLGATKTKAANGDPHVTSAELLNAAFVAVPSNRDAVVLTAKAMAMKGLTHTKTAEGRPVATKAVAGSHEARHEDVLEALVESNTDAIRAAFPDVQPGEYRWHLHIVATFDDRVVYRIGWDDDDALQVAYTWDGEKAAITGTPETVTIDQVITPASPEDAAAKAAATPPAHAGDDDLALRARAVSLAATAASS